MMCYVGVSVLYGVLRRVVFMCRVVFIVLCFVVS